MQGPPASLKFLLALWVAICKTYISIHVHQPLILFLELEDMEDSSKGSGKEAYVAHIEKIMQCCQIGFQM